MTNMQYRYIDVYKVYIELSAARVYKITNPY